MSSGPHRMSGLSGVTFEIFRPVEGNGADKLRTIQAAIAGQFADAELVPALRAVILSKREVYESQGGLNKNTRQIPGLHAGLKRDFAQAPEVIADAYPTGISVSGHPNNCFSLGKCLSIILTERDYFPLDPPERAESTLRLAVAFDTQEAIDVHTQPSPYVPLAYFPGEVPDFAKAMAMTITDPNIRLETPLTLGDVVISRYMDVITGSS